jgi:hypothetical protein
MIRGWRQDAEFCQALKVGVSKCSAVRFVVDFGFLPLSFCTFSPGRGGFQGGAQIAISKHQPVDN